MRYNKYAMPVHRKVLEQDFENTVDIDTLNEIYYTLKGKQLNDIPEDTLRKIVKYLEEAWFAINYKQGINLRDREKLIPVFSEFNRIFKGRQQTNKAYRGVRLSNFDPNALSRTYPNSINDPKVVSHLESLAYGLRSWTKTERVATQWASGAADGRGEIKDRDLVIFQLKSTEVVLDADKVLDYYYNNKYKNIINEFPMLDAEEVIVNIKNPKVVNINRSSRWLDLSTQIRFFLVEIEDMG